VQAEAFDIRVKIDLDGTIISFADSSPVEYPNEYLALLDPIDDEDVAVNLKMWAITEGRL
jgi:hypothetical protein